MEEAPDLCVTPIREVVEFEKEKFDSQQHLMSEAPNICAPTPTPKDRYPRQVEASSN